MAQGGLTIGKIANDVGQEVITSAVEKLISFLGEVKSIKGHNASVTGEVDIFVASLRQNVEELKDKLPNTDSAWAIESLEADLNNCSSYVQDCLQTGFFRASWNVNKITAELERLRRNLADSFQVKLLITALEVTIDSSKRTDDFLSKMFELSTAKSSIARTRMASLMQPLLVGVHIHDERIQELIATARQTEARVENSETQKFLEDVLWNLEVLTAEVPPRPPLGDDLDQYYDPVTFEIMFDPVKCSDGRTYNRWTIIDNNMTISPLDLNKDMPFTVVFDDVDVRGRVFDKFHDQGVEERFGKRRYSYRLEALALAKDGHLAEALPMLENVLKWADRDEDCTKLRDEALAAQLPPTAPVQKIMAPPQVYQVQPKQAPPHQQTSMDRDAQAPNQSRRRRPQDEDYPFPCRVCVLICLFPWSLCCITTLLPEAFQPPKCT